MADNWQRVAARDDIEDPGSRGFTVHTDRLPIFGFIVQRDGELYGYENVCPHAGRMLNWGPHRFLTKDQSMIMCAAHGAVFEIASGECAAGPCVGERLRAIALRVVDGQVEANLDGVGLL